jgi:hypothetical protein
VRAVGAGHDVTGEVGTVGCLGARRAQCGVEQALAVVLAEAEGLDGLIGSGAAGTAEAAAGSGGQAAMEAVWENLSRATRRVEPRSGSTRRAKRDG